MAKTNFTKVEHAFDDEMRKNMRDELLREADRVSGTPTKETAEIIRQKRVAAERKILVQALQHDIKTIEDEIFESKFKVSKESLEDILCKGINLTDKDIEELKKIKKRIDSYKKELEGFDDKLVEDERKKHINKRFNVRDKWLPLK